MDYRNPRALSDLGEILVTRCPQQDYVGTEPLCDYLWEQTKEYREKALNTPFVQGINNGTLDPVVFGGYMVQDAVYCYKAQHLIVEAANREEREYAKQYLNGLAEKYREYYMELFGKWNIKDPKGITLGEALQEYSEYESYVANQLNSSLFIIALIPCLRLWPWLGEQIQAGNHGVYAKWYENNFGPSDGYKLLEAYIHEQKDFDKEEALAVYTRCMKGEFEFFNSAK